MSEKQTCEQTDAPIEQRRGFVVLLAGAVGAIAGLVPVIASTVTFLDPVARREKKFADPHKRKGQKTEDGFIRVATLDEVPDNGEPVRVQVRDDVTNKWTFLPDEPVGEVFLMRKKGEEKPTALTTVCPHLGCSISMARDGEGRQMFKCPCHNSSFQLDGAMIAEDNPSPRPMDTLQCRVEEKQVYVKYENFYTGRGEKVVKG